MQDTMFLFQKITGFSPLNNIPSPQSVWTMVQPRQHWWAGHGIPGGCDGYDEIWTGRRTFTAPHLLARAQIEFRAVETHISKRGQRRSFPVLNDVPGGKYI